MANDTALSFDAFLSYARANDSLASRIHEDLLNRDVNVWKDDANIRAGQEWVSEIEEGFKRSRTCLLLLSPEALRSSWVRFEVQLAHMRARKDAAFRLIPVLIGAIADDDIPLMIAAVQGLDFRSKSLEHDEARAIAVERIASAIRGDGHVPRQLPFRLVVVAATSQEMAKLWSKECQHSPGFDLDQLRDALQEHAIKDIVSCYGRRPEDWCPASDEKKTIGAIVTELASAFTKHYFASGDYALLPVFLSTAFFSPDREVRNRTWSDLRDGGCVVVVDALSLYHAQVNEAFLDSGLWASERCCLVIVSPQNANASPLHDLLRTHLTKGHFGNALHRCDKPETHCHFGVGGIVPLKTCLFHVVREATEIAQLERPSEELKGLVRDRLTSRTGREKTGIQRAFMGAR